MRLFPLVLVPFGAALLAACAERMELKPVLSMGESSLEGGGDPYDAGKRLFVANRLGTAIGAFRRVLAADRGNVAAMNALAATYDRLGRYDLADVYYDRALAAVPGDAQTLNNAGFSQLMRGRVRQALLLLEDARNAAPGDPVIKANLSLAREAERTSATPRDGDGEAGRPAPLAKLSRIGVNDWSLATLSAAPAPPPPPEAAPRIPVTVAGLAPMPLLTAFAPAAAVPPTPCCKVRVVNGNGRTGAAARTREMLKAKGVEASGIANAPSFHVARTEISCRPGREAEARRLAAMLPVQPTVRTNPGQRHDLVLVLGHDFPSLD